MKLSVNSAAVGYIILSSRGGLVCDACRERCSQVARGVTRVLTLMQAEVSNIRGTSITLSNSTKVNITRSINISFVRRICTAEITTGAFVPNASIVVRLNNRSTGVLFLAGKLRMEVGNAYTNNANTFVSRVTALLGIGLRSVSRLTGRRRGACAVTSEYNIFTGASVRPLLGRNTEGDSVTRDVFGTIMDRAITNLTRNERVRNRVMCLNKPLAFVDRLQGYFSHALKAGNVYPRGSLCCITYNTTLYTRGAVSFSRIVRGMGGCHNDNGFTFGRPLFGGRRRCEGFYSHRTGTSIGRGRLGKCANGTCVKVSTNSAAMGNIILGSSNRLLCSGCLPSGKGPIRVVGRFLSRICRVGPRVGVISSTMANCKRSVMGGTFTISCNVIRAVTRFATTGCFVPSIRFVVSVNKRSVGYFGVRGNTVSGVFLGRTYSSNYKDFLRAFTGTLKCRVTSFTGLKLFTGHPISLNSHYAMFVGSDIGRTRGSNTAVRSVSTNLSLDIMGGTLCGIVHTSDPSRLNGHIIIRNNAFLGSTILHTFRRRVNIRIIHPGVTKLVNTCNTTLCTGGGSGNINGDAVASGGKLSRFIRRVGITGYNVYGGGYHLAVGSFNGNEGFVTKGHYREPVAGGTPTGSVGVCTCGLGLVSSCGPIRNVENGLKVPVTLGVCRLCPF